MTPLGKNDEATYKSMSARLRLLRDEFEPHYDEPSTADVPEAPAPPPSREGELLFVAGPRTGERLSVEGRAVALDRDGNESGGEGASSLVVRIWTQADNIMLQHSGAILVGGSRPALPIVVLEDGDELAWGGHKLQFRRAPAVGR